MISVNSSVIDYELEMKLNSNSLITVAANSHLIYDQDGRPAGIEGSLHDITLRKKVEEALINEKERLDGVIRGTNAGSWEWNIQTGEAVLNDRWAEIIGYRLEELFPISIETWIAHLHPDDLYKARDLLRKHFNGTLDYFDAELRMRHKNGGWVWVLDRGRVSKWSPGGKPLLMMGTHMDISGRKESEEKIYQINRAKSMYLARLGHEIRTPLSAVTGMIELALGTDLESERLEYLNTAKQSSSHLISLINDVLDYSKIEAGALVLESVPFNPLEEIRNVISIFKYICSEKNIYLNLNADNNTLNYCFSGDPTRFRQVIINIIGNAVKFTETGGINVIMEYSDVGFTDGIVNLNIRIKDTGTGIPAEKIDIIFDNFSQAEPGISGKYGGSGLGLAITRELVEMMGGRVMVESSPGKGSLFIIDIPLKTACMREGAATEAIEERMHECRINCNTGYSVLVAEDNPVIMKLVSVLLGKNGFMVTGAVNGAEVIETLSEKRFDVVLMDLEMPVFDGLETAGRIRSGIAGGENIDIPIIALTAHKSDEINSKCIEAGMDGILLKPMKIDLFISMVKSLIETKGRNC